MPEQWQATLTAIRKQIAAAHGMTVPQMRTLVLVHERTERCPGAPFAALPSGHALNGGTDCDGC